MPSTDLSGSGRMLPRDDKGPRILLRFDRSATRFDPAGLARIYVATPLVIFQAPVRYFKMVKAWVKKAAPNAELIFGAHEFSSTKDWKARWADVRGSVDAVLFAADPYATIGKGVYQEVQDALEAGLPVGYVVGPDMIVTSDEFEIVVVDPNDRMRYAKVIPKP